MDYLKIKNWTEFQHYKDRNPPWIKLHRTLLDDYEFACLQDASKLHLMLIWLLGSQSDGRVPSDPKFLQGKLGLKSAPDLQALISHGFLIPEQNASNPLAPDASNLHLETEAYKSRQSNKGTRFSDETKTEGWSEFCKAERPDLDPQEVFVTFRDYWVAVPGSKGLKLDWTATWRNWVKNQRTVGGKNGKFNAVQYNARELAKALDKSPASQVQHDLHGEVHEVLPRLGNG